jgi:plasmid segregation protein ParM
MADNLMNNNHESEDLDMTKLREYNMNGTIILGVDAGYGNYKTARCCFPTSVSRSSQPPVFTRDYLEYNGGYYTIGEGHKDFVAEKSRDGDNYILTLAAIAKELKARGLSSAKIHLAVGLPLKWVQAQRESFREYMMQNRHVDYKYAGKRYEVDIVDCTVMPQCYAAIAESLPDFKGMYMIADIGNGTMNVMILNNGKASESKSWTVKLGANECFMAICNLILDRKAEELPAEIIENYLRYGDTKVGVEFQQLMEEAAKSYVNRIFAELKAHGYNPNLMKLYIMGGGAKVVEFVGDYDSGNVTFNPDIRANAKGYEYFCYMKLRRQKSMASAG